MPPTSVCFVVTEILGTAPFGGIATATTHGALVLSKHGYDVEILYCGPDPELSAEWAARYESGGVAVRRLDRTRPVGPEPVADSYRIYEQLRDDPPDVVVFQDWLGLGFCSMLAKRAGEFSASRLVHICHGPTDWLREANRRQLVDAWELATAWMERRSAELADTVVGPSRYLVDWMAAQGWSLPSDQHVIPYFTEGHVSSLDGPPPPTPAEHRLGELVFFGRLEERKGVQVFVQALNRLGAAALQGVGVTFLGRDEPLPAETVLATIDPGIRAAVTIRFERNLDQAAARAYLAEPGRVAVIPSLLDNSPNVIYECLEDGIPFLASASGGNPELIHPDDRARVLFDPEPAALQSTLAAVLASAVVPAPARPAFDGRASLEAWSSVLSPTAPGGLDDPAAGVDVDVAVVIPHHNQAAHLPAAVSSAASQRHGRLEVVVVDDGSTDPEALDSLARVEAAEWPCPVRVLRQANRYLGAARNAGVRATSAPYVAFCDDDDELDERFVATLVGVAERTGAAAAVCALLNRDAATWDDPLVPTDPVWMFLDGAAEIGTVWNTFGGAGLVVRRDAFEQIGGFHEQAGVGHEDWDFLARLVLAGFTIAAVPAPLYRYRIRPGSMIRTTSQFRNAAKVNAAYAAGLPAALARWPTLVRGQHLVIDEQRRQLADLRAEVDQLRIELERRTRFVELLRKARAGA